MRDADQDLSDLLALDMEYRLTVALRAIGDDCDCSRYLIQRRDVLLPEVLESARRHEADPADWFAQFARRLHGKCEATTAPAPTLPEREGGE